MNPILLYIGACAVLLGTISVLNYWYWGGSLKDVWKDEETK